MRSEILSFLPAINVGKFVPLLFRCYSVVTMPSEGRCYTAPALDLLASWFHFRDFRRNPCLLGQRAVDLCWMKRHLIWAFVVTDMLIVMFWADRPSKPWLFSCFVQTTCCSRPWAFTTGNSGPRQPREVCSNFSPKSKVSSSAATDP